MKKIPIMLISFFLILRLPTLGLAAETLPDNSKEMKDFWAKGYKAKWISQTQPVNWEGDIKNGMGFNDQDEYFDVYGSNEVEVVAKFKNTGTETWYKASAEKQVCIAIYKDPKVESGWSGKENLGESEFKHSDWISKYRIACIEEDEVVPGDIGTFRMKFNIPLGAPSGRFREDISLASGKYWMESNKETADSIGVAHIWVGFDIFGELEIAEVGRVIDGDTIELSDGRKVRYVGIDTPEVGECFYEDAKNKNAEYVRGEEVLLLGDPIADNKDRYGRLLRYIYIENYIKSINYQLVKEGYAEVYAKYPNHIPPMFFEAEKQARNLEQKYWGTCLNYVDTPTSVSTNPPYYNATLVPTSIPTDPTTVPAETYSYNCYSNAYNCGDFSTCLEVVNVYNYCISQGAGDIHKLDRDNDGIPCESICD